MVIQTAALADADFRAVLRWTEVVWGRRYAQRLAATLARLEDGPTMFGTADRADLGPGILILRMSSSGPPARHILLFRVDEAAAEPTVMVLRIFHESIDPALHPLTENPT